MNSYTCPHTCSPYHIRHTYTCTMTNAWPHTQTCVHTNTQSRPPPQTRTPTNARTHQHIHAHTQAYTFRSGTLTYARVRIWTTQDDASPAHPPVRNAIKQFALGSFAAHTHGYIYLLVYPFVCLNLHASNSPTPGMISPIRIQKYLWARHSTTRGEWLPFRIFLCSNGANHPRGG